MQLEQTTEQSETMSVDRAHESTSCHAWHEIEVFYDGDCPLCQREIAMLRRLDQQHRICFSNIAANDFDADSVSKTHTDLMAEIHGRLPDGTWVSGVEVFRRLYAAVGFRRIVSLTRLPVISQTLNFGYRWFARNRLKLTGRCSNDNGQCSLPSTPLRDAAAPTGEWVDEFQN